MPLMADKPALALSRDGARLAYVAQLSSGSTRIYLVELATGAATPVAGTDGGHTPVFSPDGASLAFFADGALNKVSLTGGTRVVLAGKASNPCGASWGDDGYIYFNRMDGEGILRVSADGGPVNRVFDSPYTLMPAYLGPGMGMLAAGRHEQHALDRQGWPGQTTRERSDAASRFHGSPALRAAGRLDGGPVRHRAIRDRGRRARSWPTTSERGSATAPRSSRLPRTVPGLRLGRGPLPRIVRLGGPGHREDRTARVAGRPLPGLQSFP